MQGDRPDEKAARLARHHTECASRALADRQVADSTHCHRTAAQQLTRRRTDECENAAQFDRHIV